MKRCKSDEFDPEEVGAQDASPPHSAMDMRSSDYPIPGDVGPAGAFVSHGPPTITRNKPPDLKKIQQLSEGSMFGHGLKHLFHSRRRSRERDHQPAQDSTVLPSTPGPTTAQVSSGATLSSSDHDSADEKERSPEMHRVSYAVSLHDLPARPTAFNRVLQQIRSRPSVKRGSGHQVGGRRSKSGPGDTAHHHHQSLRGGSPHLPRRVPPLDGGLAAVLHHHQGRPRSSSTTDAALLAAGDTGATGGLAHEDPERTAEKQVDKGDLSTLSLPPSTAHGGSEGNISLEVPEGAPDPQRTKAAMDHLHQKILKITEQIKIEQEARDDNVAEYLKLANNADRQQALRIKQVFEKKNQKSAQTIAQLHKKLEHYHKKLKEIEQNGISRQPKDVLRDMQQGLKDVGANVRAGISGFGGGVVEGVKGGLSGLSQVTHTAVVSKPREFASLIRNKFGSADNIPHLKDQLEEDGEGQGSSRALSGSATLAPSPKYGSDDECSSATSGSAGAGSNSGAGQGGPGSPRSNTLDGHHHVHHGGFEAILEELCEIKDGQSHLEDSIEDLKSQLQRDYSYMTQCLQEERYRYERLEEQLNDLTELHQNEMTLLKQELASMEEKVAYQSYERARDIQEAVESCLTRITKLELQQQQQQVVQLEGVENANARALLGKFINVLLALMAVLLVFVSTTASFITPLVKTRLRLLSSILFLLSLLTLWRHWDNVTYCLEHVLLPS
ncbi:transmembrane and coiled-coil domains protein 2 isoform X1 [Bombina bombina]|uniref:transmembrane and coiled-coil domains protein 2 isoform X1 n=1 Tax=Bombina bombina TaxID=8345 RepID=UPI00235AD5D1|nr:transmembrane and coiled-coil domains protein 2 isoform X1 [Bombina bombina]